MTPNTNIKTIIANSIASLQAAQAYIQYLETEVKRGSTALHTDVSEENLDPGFDAHFRYMMEHWDISDVVETAVNKMDLSPQVEEVIEQRDFSKEWETLLDDELFELKVRALTDRFIEESTGLQTQVNEAVDERLNDELLEPLVKSAVDQAMSDLDLEKRIEDLVEEAVEERLKDLDVEDQISEALRNQEPELERRVEQVVEDKVREVAGELTAGFPDELMRLLRDDTNLQLAIRMVISDALVDMTPHVKDLQRQVEDAKREAAQWKQAYEDARAALTPDERLAAAIGATQPLQDSPGTAGDAGWINRNGG